MADGIDSAREVVDLALADLRRVGAIRRYRAGEVNGAVRAVAELRGNRGAVRGEVRLEAEPLDDDVAVAVRWTSPLGGRWWAEAVDLRGAVADPYGADWSQLDAVIADVRRWAAGSINPKELTAAYSRPPLRKSADDAWARGLAWA
jgi:hypothetical protein